MADPSGDGLKRDIVEISNVGDARFTAYAVSPTDEPKAALVLLHTMFGINDSFRDFCDEYAMEGYRVIAPDLFWRLSGDAVLDYSEESYEKGHGHIKSYDLEAGMRDVEDTLAFVRANATSVEKIGVVGYCMGGTVAFVAAARTSADAAICYYPIYVERHLSHADRIGVPTVIHLGTADKYAPPAVFGEIEGCVRGRPNITFHAYPGADHGFANRMVARQYDEAATRLAWSRSMVALRDALIH